MNDEKDRVNFFYYNNGITIICDKLSTVTPDGKNRSTFEITNPQIVNGCQTVNSIVEVLDSKSDEYRNAEFQNTYVMAKILVLDATDEAKQDLYQKIVKYNNSQNAINEKSFIALSELFLRIQKEFMEKGFILCIKQSDKNKYKALYKNPKELLDRSARLRERFGLNLTKTNDFLIDLEKLLQVCLAFCDSGVAAFQKKNQLLVKDSKYNDEVVDFIQSVTTQTLLNLYLLYLRSEQTKKEKNNKNPKVPVSFYLIDCYGHYECGGDSNKILKMIQDKDSINHLIKIYKIATAEYLRRHINDKEGNSYTSMNKLPIDYNRMTECRLNAINALEDAE